MHKSETGASDYRHWWQDKTVVMGMLERGGNVRAMVVDNRRKKELQKQCPRAR